MQKRKIQFSSIFTRGKKAEAHFQWSKARGLELFPIFWSQNAQAIVRSKYFRNGEESLQQLVGRVVLEIKKSAQKNKLFASSKDLNRFIEELKFLIYSQRASFNSPVWFNLGIHKNPQVSACFIQSIEDSIEGIFSLAQKEAKLFKYGSGSGTNFSNLRSRYEEIDSGGKSSGLMSFLEVLDKGAGAIKSGGTTRRAAKMVILDVDHPEVMDFIHWKTHEEKKALALIEAGVEAGFEGEAYRTVSGQNSNNSVRVTNRFMNAVAKNLDWALVARTTGKTLEKLPARKIWSAIANAAWLCADPGIQYHDTINKFNTCPKSGTIEASNPCSEFMFLNETACNLASINLAHYFDDQDDFLVAEYLHTVRLLIVAQELLVGMAGYPSEEIRLKSLAMRPLGLGFTNLGAVLMRMGIPYGSEEAAAWAGMLSSMMTGAAYLASNECAKVLGAFAEFNKNKKDFTRVLNLHKSSSRKIQWVHLSSELKQMTIEIWEDVLHAASRQGFRNSQVTLIAPTGTIGLMMDCDTFGIEPEFSFIKNKKMAGGGVMSLQNLTVERALKNLGYDEMEREKIFSYLEKNGELVGCPLIHGHDQDIFSCAVGKKALSAGAHLVMMAAVQPHISGAISKTVNLPHDATAEQIAEIYLKAHQMGLKSISVYRDGSKGDQPLSAMTGDSNNSNSCGISSGGCS